MILNQIAEATKIRVQRAKESLPLKKLKERATNKNQPFAFEKALSVNEFSFICEVKKGSPSKGIIAQNFPYVSIAKEYESAGAHAISVLTEPEFFLGKSEYLTEIKNNVRVPVLRKDFIIDEYQIFESAAMGADAILLICALLDEKTIKEYIFIADELGLSSMVEAHNENEASCALRAGARIIGINNRDLRTFNVDIQNSIRLRKLIPENIIFVSESGIKTPGDIRALRQIGANAVLIGETLMRCVDKKAEIKKLMEGGYV